MLKQRLILNHDPKQRGRTRHQNRDVAMEASCAPKVGESSVEEVQEVGYWLDLTNSGVMETTSELAPVLPPS